MASGDDHGAGRVAQRLWQAAEAVHAVTYFARPVRRAVRAAGAPGFWAGYFGTRLAPLRTADPVLATSVLYVFAAPMVAEHLPPPEDGAAWDAARRAAVSDVLAGLGDGDRPGRDAWAAAARQVRTLVDACDVRARPLFAAHAGLPWPDVEADPWSALWHGVTLLREFRGDGHLHALAGERLSGCEAMVLALRWRDHGAAADESTAADRGWTADEIAEAYAGLAARGWVDRHRGLTDAGRHARAAIEAATDARALPAGVEDTTVAALADTLAPLAALALPLIPRRNPIGITGTA
jgi:hypothetical protein